MNLERVGRVIHGALLQQDSVERVEVRESYGDDVRLLVQLTGGKRVTIVLEDPDVVQAWIDQGFK